MGTDRYQIIQQSDYPTIPILTKVYSYFCYCSYTWAVQIILAVFPSYICCWFRVIRFLSFFFWAVERGILISYYRDVEGPKDRGSGVFIAGTADE